VKLLLTLAVVSFIPENMPIANCPIGALLVPRRGTMQFRRGDLCRNEI
jgi:hypothetical protein